MVLPNNTRSNKSFGQSPNPGNQQVPGPSATSGRGFGDFFGGVDWNNVEASFGGMAEGWDEMYVESVEPATSSNGNPQLVFTFRALYDSEGNEVSGRPKYWMTKTDKTLGFIQRDMAALGVHPSEASIPGLLNRHVRVKMGKNEGGRDPEMIVVRQLAPSQMFEPGSKYSPPRPGVPGQ